MSEGIAGPLREIKALLEDAKIPYMVVGSFASTVHGEPRTTLDLDIVIDPTPTTLDHVLSHIDMDAYYVDPDTARDALRRRAMFNTSTAPPGGPASSGHGEPDPPARHPAVWRRAR